jgi:hypothetical protein
VSLKIALESLAVEGQGEMCAGKYRIVGRGENFRGEGKGIAYRAPDPDMKLPSQGNPNQRGP